mmetsp:Transcript_27792/g.57109  ORF Transcript_27792/g.57109 Transcript_27792/m.57109 type:complete len:262 (+) Transcript_27792:1651-2436(+)
MMFKSSAASLPFVSPPPLSCVARLLFGDGEETSPPLSSNPSSPSASSPVAFGSTSQSSSRGVNTTPKNDPSAELNTALASFPAAALVNITDVLTGGGMQPTTMKPCTRGSGIQPAAPYRKAGTSKHRTSSGEATKLKLWMNTCWRQSLNVSHMASVRMVTPEMKKMLMMAPYFTVTCGFNGPKSEPSHGRACASTMLNAVQTKNQCFSEARTSVSVKFAATRPVVDMVPHPLPTQPAAMGGRKMAFWSLFMSEDDVEEGER